MTRKDEFVTLVQTAAIVESLSRKNWPSNRPKLSMMAAAAVSSAMEVSEEKLPDSLYEACEKHIDYVYDETIPKPIWFLGIL